MDATAASINFDCAYLSVCPYSMGLSDHAQRLYRHAFTAEHMFEEAEGKIWMRMCMCMPSGLRALQTELK